VVNRGISERSIKREETSMREDSFRDKLTQLRGELNHQWKQFTPDDLARIDGTENLVVLLESRYGFARPRAEKEAAIFIREFRERILMAS
jgi:hypothetical protein